MKNKENNNHLFKRSKVNFNNIMGIHKIEVYDPNSSNLLERVVEKLSELKDNPNETYAWRFEYKGEKYANAITGKRSKPITDEDIIVLMQGMVETMKYLRNKNKGE